MMDFCLLSRSIQKPSLFAKSTSSLWDDDHISKEMLAAHLNPEFDAASRKHAFIDRSAHWILQYTGLKKGAKVLDLGCGPGLYAEKLASFGLKLTGIDFSKRSIAYAKTQAERKNLVIDYLYQNYLDMDFQNAFDMVMMIYCDFGVLSYTQRDVILDKIHRSLKRGGIFLFDVSSFELMNRIAEKNTWSICKSGFFRPYPYICFESVFSYPKQDVLLTQYTVIDKRNTQEIYRIWNQTYSKETINAVFIEKGFEVVEVFSHLDGSPFHDTSDTLGIVSIKKDEET